MANTVKNKNRDSVEVAFPPTDRELALRGEIKTGWSTIALHQNLKNLSLSGAEKTKIESVLKRAETVERINQLRIGVELMKHRRNKEKQLGDGQTTCLICGVDFSNHQYRRKPVSIHFCDKCSSAICSSCMLADKKKTGENITLCQTCYEEKEIWKRSGAWFYNALPVIDFSQTELEEFEEKQQRLSQSREFTLGKHTDETTAREFVNPYQLEAESSDESDDELNSLNLRNSPTPEPPAAAAAASTSFPPPISFIDTPHLQQALQRPSAQKPTASSTFPRGMASPSDFLDEFRDRTSGSEPGETITRRLEPLGDDEGEGSGGRSQRIIRRGAMSTVDKSRLESSRKKALGAVSNSSGSQESVSSSGGSPSHQSHKEKLTSSLTSSTSSESIALEFVKTAPKRAEAPGGKDGSEQRQRQLPNPPRRPPPQLLTLEEEEGEHSLKLDQSTVEVVVDPPTPKPRKPPAPAAAAPVVRRKRESQEKAKPLEDEFKKVAVVAPSAHPPPSMKPPVLPSATDEFRKVGLGTVAAATMASAATTTNKPPPPTKPAPVPEVDEFKKVSTKSKPPPRVPGTEDDEFKKVSSSVPESPTRKPPALPPKEEFRKVSPPRQEVVKKPAPTPRADLDEFRKVSTAKSDTAKKQATPPSLPPKTDMDEFRKVGVASAGKPPAFPRKQASFEEKRSLSSSSSRDVTPPKKASVSPSGSPLRKSHGEVPPPLPEKPKASREEPRHQDSPKRTPERVSSSTRGQSDEENKSIVSTSSLASQSSSRYSPSASTPPRNQSPISSSTSTASVVAADEQGHTSLRRQGEVDEDQSFRFRSRSGAVRGGSRGRSSSPGVQQVDDKKPETKKDDHDPFADFDDFQPRARSRSKAFDSHQTRPSRGVTQEDRPQPAARTIRTVQSVASPQQQQSSGDSQEDMTKVATSASDDTSQPRMRTRSRAIRGDTRRQRHTTGTTTTSSSRVKEESPADNDDDFSQPRTRTRSRALRGDSQRPTKKFNRTPSPSSVAAASGPGDSSTLDVHRSSLEIPQSAARPRSSSTGQSVRIESDGAHTLTKPNGAFGAVELELEYVERENLLKVTVDKCKGLRAMDGNGFSDPYVKLFLMPGNRIHKFQTRTRHKNLDPVFDETFIFYSVSMEAMQTKQLCIIVMDYDEFSADDFIGATRVKLYEVLYSQSHKINIRRLLDDNIVAMQSALEDKTRGRVRLTFSYSPEREVFNVYVHRADHLVPHSSKRMCDPYVKCYFESADSGGTCMKKKTNVNKKTLSPVFDQVLEFPDKLAHLGLACLTVSVWDRSKLPSMEIGEVHFRDAAFWKNFVEHPNLTVTEWYVLYAPDHSQHSISPKHHKFAFSRKYM